MDSDCASLSRSSLMQTVLAISLVSVFELLYAGRSGAVLQCHYCPLQAAGRRCNITTECRAHERCSSGWRRYGGVYLLAVQGCASTELCGSNQTLSYKGFEYKITYTCCCRDLCNKAASSENNLKQLLRITISPADNITADPLSCPND
ncbi:Protein Bouncer [Labeo rohita]|uniref:Protein Bouncer n=1 Tax=Labeo rohita TaxID=84645 RepID=A0ABQ8LU29_LABRO|nr:sperm acrosome membrane-associated protein 4 [Labeo rohita]KAI2653791.1 Protein Bouncer [Labeo rohita]